MLEVKIVASATRQEMNVMLAEVGANLAAGRDHGLLWDENNAAAGSWILWTPTTIAAEARNG